MRRPGKAWLDREEVIALVREAQGGDLRALDALLVRLRPSLLRFFARRLGRDAAEDAAQEALIRIARAFRRIDAEGAGRYIVTRSEEHTSELQSLAYLVCRLLLEKKK